MNGSWWKLTRLDVEYLVLVVNGRVAVSPLFRVYEGERWTDARKRFEAMQYVCTMEST